MDIYQLRSFVVLAEHLHFGRAAKALHLSQPALTKQIRRLEEDLGSSLFERAHGATRLSSVGETWLPQVRELLARFDQTATLGKKTASGATGRLRIGFGFHTLQLVPAIVVELRRTAPDSLITLRDMSTAEQAAALGAGLLDVGFMRTPLAEPAKYQTMPAIKDRLTLVAPKTAGRPTKRRLADFRNEPFVSISRERSPGFSQHMLNLCSAHGFHPRIVQEVHEFPTAIALVRAGMGITMIPESLSTADVDGVQRHRLEDRRAVWTVDAVWRRGDTNPLLAEFVRLLQLRRPR
ncbi:MAG: LysR family transcriptional regulator [Verrucomicrobiota bacterium]